MININSEHKNLYVNAYKFKPDFQYEMQFDGFKLVNSDFVKDSFELTESICQEESIVFGSCNSSQLKITLANVMNVSHGKTFTLVQKVNNIYTMPLGTFTVFSATKQEDKRYTDIIAYDNMQKFNTEVLEWYNGLTYPLTLKQFRDSLCSYIGVTQKAITLVNDSIAIEKTISANTLNGLNVLKSICEINGVFGHINRYGSLSYISLNPTPIDTIAKENIREIKYEQYTDNTITKVQIRQEDGDVGAYSGTGTNCYYITGNFLAYGKSAYDLQTISDNVATKIVGLTYRTYTGEMTGRPDIEVGDYVTYNVISTYLFKRVLKGFQALIDSIEAKGTEKLTEDTSLNVQITQLQGKSAIMKRTVEGIRSTVSDINNEVGSINENITELKQTSTEISSTVSSVQTTVTEINNKAKYELIIVSSNGNIFKNGDVQTTLTAIVKSWDTDITDTIDANQLIWTRVSKDTAADKAWNASHAGGSKSIIVTSNDVKARATFFCDLIDTTTRLSLL